MADTLCIHTDTWVSHKFCNILVTFGSFSALPDTFVEIVEVTNHTGL